MRKIIEDAKKVRELYVQLWEVDSVDDNCDVEDYDDNFIIDEAKYVLSNYSEPGHICAEMLASKCGRRKSSFYKLDPTIQAHTEWLNSDSHRWECERCLAKNDVKELTWFLKKYKAI